MQDEQVADLRWDDVREFFDPDLMPPAPARPTKERRR